MPNTSIRRAAGFGLVEIMVALVIGMLAVIVMLQVFSLSEERKRTTTGGGDAQSAGAIMLYQLQKDISQAGYGFSALNLFNCNLTWTLPAGGSIATPIRLAPVTINPGASIIPAGDANTDTLLIVYGNTNGEPQGNPITAQAGTVYTVQMPNAFASGDRVIAAPAACAGNLLLDRIAQPPAATSVQVATGAAGITLFNLGPEPRVLAYAVRGGNLTVCDYMVNDCGTADTTNRAIWVPIASNIVSMRALYGRDTASPVRTQAQIDAINPRPNYVVDTYNQTLPNTGCAWARVSSIQLVLVARNVQLNRQDVTSDVATAQVPVPNAPTWAGSATAPINLSGDAQWKRYRYKAFEGVVPIRNAAWMGVQAGC